MDKLTQLEQEALVILRQLQYRCDEFELHSDDEGKKVLIMVSDVDPRFMKRTENLYNVAKYLQKNGIDFSITFDLMNDSPLFHINSEHPTDDFIELGEIKGESIQAIKTRIEELIDELGSKNTSQIKKKIITYNIDIGKLTFNETDGVILEGIQKDVIDRLIEAGVDKKVSWDDINERIADDVTVELSKAEIVDAKKSIHGAVTQINKKTERYFEHESKLIELKDNEYWLQHTIKIDG